MDGQTHINSTMYSLINRSITGPMRNVSHSGLIAKHNISHADVTEGKDFDLRIKIQPDLRLG